MYVFMYVCVYIFNMYAYFVYMHVCISYTCLVLLLLLLLLCVYMHLGAYVEAGVQLWGISSLLPPHWLQEQTHIVRFVANVLTC